MLRSARTADVTVTTFMPPSTATFSASVVGKSVTSSRALRFSPPPWRKLTLSVSPGPVSSMTASQSRNVRSRRPRAFTSTSPATTPARPAGPPGATRVTRRPPARPLPSAQILGARDVEPHPGTPHLPEAPQLVRHPQRPLDRDRKSDSHRSARAREDRAVHPDHVPHGVRERPARIAGVDRRVGLYHADIDAGLPLGGKQVPPDGAHHARRHRGLRVAEQVGERVAHRYDPLPDHQVGALTERSGREARRVHLQHRDVRERVLTLDLRREIPSIARRDDDLLSPLRDVLVGDHHPVGRDDEAGSVTLHHLLSAAGCEELLEGILRQLSLAPQDIDTYHRRSEPAGGRDDRSLARLGEILTCEVWRQCHSSDRSSEEQRGSFHRENLTRLTRVGRAGKSGNAR